MLRAALKRQRKQHSGGIVSIHPLEFPCPAIIWICRANLSGKRMVRAGTPDGQEAGAAEALYGALWAFTSLAAMCTRACISTGKRRPMWGTVRGA